MLNRVMSLSSRVIGAIDSSKPLQKLGRAFHNNTEKALAYTTVGSVIVKDGIGCYKYVTQSLNNEKIPEEKRKFVAALDLTNGVLMIVSQIALFFAMRKLSGPLFNKLFKKSFNPESAKQMASRIRMNQEKTGVAVSRKLNIEKGYNNVKKDALGIFKFIADLSAATIIGKRVIVPLIATPLADKVKKKMDLHSAGKSGETENAETPKAAEPAFDGRQLDVVSSGTSNLLERYRLQNQ